MSEEQLVAAIGRGLEARGLLNSVIAPLARLRRRVGYAIRDALAQVRSDRAPSG